MRNATPTSLGSQVIERGGRRPAGIINCMNCDVVINSVVLADSSLDAKNIIYVYINMYVYMYICMCMCIYVRVYVYMYAYMHMYIYIYIYIFVCV